MQSNINEIVFRLLRKNSLAEVSLQQLEDLVKDFPYFSLTRYLLARKAMETNAANKKVRAQELALYIPNTYWQNYVLTTDLSTTNEGEPEKLEEHWEAEELNKPTEQLDGSTPEETADHLAQTLSKIKIEASAITETDLIPLDPYHRIDYFASQGIRLDKDALVNDNVGRKLKKFTEWLKTMKRIPENESSADIDEHTSRNIQNLAARSLLGTEILTEAMAEVYVKQKLYAKAIYLYKKLSLQNPAKSTYFASRIEELNKFVS